MRFLLYQNIIPKIFMVDAFLGIGYQMWFSHLQLHAETKEK